MPHPPDTEVAAPVLCRELALVGQIALGPAASFVALLALYYRTGEKCTGASRFALAALPLVAGLVAGAALWAALRSLRRAQREAHDRPPRTTTRTRFMVHCSFALNGFALLLVLGLLIPVLFLRPCE
jgi:hypothetical protein